MWLMFMFHSVCEGVCQYVLTVPCDKMLPVESKVIADTNYMSLFFKLNNQPQSVKATVKNFILNLSKWYIP